MMEVIKISDEKRIGFLNFFIEDILFRTAKLLSDDSTFEPNGEFTQAYLDTVDNKVFSLWVWLLMLEQVNQEILLSFRNIVFSDEFDFLTKEQKNNLYSLID